MTPRANEPMDANDDTLQRLTTNLWYWKKKFLVKQELPDGFRWHVFNKFEDKQGKDLCWYSNTLHHAKLLMDIMSEDIPREIVESLQPKND